MYKFPDDFRWGVSTAAYQIEGGWLEGGKGLSIWDVFTHTPGKILNGDKGDVACDSFHRYEEDVKILKELGVKAYRLSLAWPRIIPDGNGEINQEGIEYYSELFNLLLENDIEPWVTLYHWDLPASLQMEYGGWLNSKITDDFENYARVCFENFGDKVKNWITLNEPWVTSLMGFMNGEFAPGSISNSEPYIVGHHQLIAHAKTAKLYHKEFKPSQNGQIGLAVNCSWFEPKTDSPKDMEASERALEFSMSWFTDPIYKGDYPEVMKQLVGDRLPEFTVEEKELLKGSSDFFGLNHYQTYFVEEYDANKDATDPNVGLPLNKDENVLLSEDPNWEKTFMGWSIIPWGMKKLVQWIDKRYDSPPIVITENGAAFEQDKINVGKVADPYRVDFLKAYIGELTKAMESGVKINGYFVWSLMDNFEWAYGFSKRFGLYFVDFETLDRIPKDSAKWYRSFIERNEI